MSLKSSFIEHLLKKYPNLSAEQLDSIVSEQLISPFQVALKESVIKNIQTEITKFWKLRTYSEQKLSASYDTLGLIKPKNLSVCMSYDFHLNADDQLELIEINTNAAFLAVGLELYSFWNLKNVAADFSEHDLVAMFLNEMRLAGVTSAEKSVAILDEAPQQQRLFLEFLLYKEMFKKQNIQSEIFDLADAEKTVDYSLIYNRYTDFYLQEEKSKFLKQQFNAGKMHLSPNPWEYFLSADKQRLIDWFDQTEVEKPNSLLPVYDMAKTLPEKVWAERKNLFFKPKTSFGSKQAYRGSSISKRVFDEVCKPDFIAQQISTPSEIDVVFNHENLKLKYDLRCYVYDGKLQLIIARLYQGQATNLRTAGGGFACVTIKD